MPRIKIELEGFRCARCGHEWIPRKDEAPRVCPRCKSPFWDHERTLLSFRVEAGFAVDRGSRPGRKHLQSIERRIGAGRRPVVRVSTGRVRVLLTVRAATPANAQILARRLVSSSARAVGIPRAGPVEVTSVRAGRRTSA